LAGSAISAAPVAFSLCGYPALLLLLGAGRGKSASAADQNNTDSRRGLPYLVAGTDSVRRRAVMVLGSDVKPQRRCIVGDP
jgi:hypothetical protein